MAVLQSHCSPAEGNIAPNVNAARDSDPAADAAARVPVPQVTEILTYRATNGASGGDGGGANADVGATAITVEPRPPVAAPPTSRAALLAMLRSQGSKPSASAHGAHADGVNGTASHRHLCTSVGGCGRADQLAHPRGGKDFAEPMHDAP